MKDTAAQKPGLYTAHPGRMDALARLASGFAHDINNVLGAIEGYAALAAGGLPAGSQARQDIGGIREAVAEAAALTSLLLLFAGRRPLSKAACDPAGVLRDAAARARAAAPAGVAVEEEAAALGGELLADAARLGLALDAAAKFALAPLRGGGKVKFSLSAGPGGHLRFAVLGSGELPPAADPERLFEPYYSPYPGLKGPGLALAHGVAALHGGRAEAAALPGQGTEISLLIPAPKP